MRIISVYLAQDGFWWLAVMNLASIKFGEEFLECFNYKLYNTLFHPIINRYVVRVICPC